ncbi:helix-turn-helix transcriptional regulator [Candidimonas humi]|uniref:Helix-turn-helix transcriptional regulator n=1 Tax=Candidimonas humi TaxID=683355 RepID=A0ABV8NWV9_9BURK|nr:helix-turn-helix transcriptional regulator [Candidimonas humi]MBV6305193.1 helix-turn-helix transcriptional regulator [Candidimonas humi]
MIDAVGSRQFNGRLLGFLHGLCGAEHCVAFRMGDGLLSHVASASLDGSEYAHEKVRVYIGDQYWRRDPAVKQALDAIGRDEHCIVRMDFDHFVDAGLKAVIWPEIRGRVLISGSRQDTGVALSVLRGGHAMVFSDTEVGLLDQISGVLLSVVAKHLQSAESYFDVQGAIRNLPGIERLFMQQTHLTQREAQTCARVVHGMYSAGIALDLGVGEESVKTYRKRAYEKLGVSSEKELLVRYLSWCSTNH